MASEQVIYENNPKLLFLNYTIKTDNNKLKEATFINQIITDGKLKNSNQKLLKTPSIGDLKCSQLDENSSELTTVFIKNPLIKVIEALNDSLSFSRHKIEQKKAPLSLKLQLHPQAKFVVLSNVTDSLQNTLELIKTKLK